MFDSLRKEKIASVPRCEYSGKPPFVRASPGYHHLHGRHHALSRPDGFDVLGQAPEGLAGNRQGCAILWRRGEFSAVPKLNGRPDGLPFARTALRAYLAGFAGAGADVGVPESTEPERWVPRT